MDAERGGLRDWIGRRTEQVDLITAAPIGLLAATLDRDDPPARPGDPIPPLWHWLFHLPRHRASDLGPDGHAERGAFLPPVPLPRRMWAGSRFELRRPLRIGEEVRKASIIADVREKTGRSGPLVFVTVRHELGPADDPAIVEEQDLVYRPAPVPGGSPVAGAAPAEPTGAEFSRAIRPDEALLFRYSALTFNGHRIHYDWRYVTEVEGYPGLIVHGPLLATLLLDLLRRERPAAVVSRFAFRAVSPLFLGADLTLAGRWTDGGAALWASGADGRLAMDAEATLR
ncbi:MAG: MaoC family dehydratase N-terminal domain-containing protein [Gemmatimonadales bacterium]